MALQIGRVRLLRGRGRRYRAIQQLKQVVIALRMMPVGASVNIPFVTQLLDRDGVIHGNEVMTQTAADMLDELAKVQAALTPLHSAA